MLADADPSATPEDAPAAEPDAEVAFTMRDLSPMLPKLKISLVTPNDEIVSRVREAAEWSEKAEKHVPVTSDVMGIKLAYAGPATADPYAGFGARIVPENITLLPKTTNETTGGNPFNEKVVIAKKGDTLGSILHDLGAAQDDIDAIAKVLRSRGATAASRKGRSCGCCCRPVPGTKQVQPVRVIIAGNSSIDAVVALSDLGKYVPVDVRNVDTEVADNAGSRPRKTTAAASASIRAFTRRRCATRSRSR